MFQLKSYEIFDKFKKGKLGTQHGPSCLKTEYLYKNLKNLGCEVVDYDVVKDIPVQNEKLKYKNTKNYVEVGKVNEKVIDFFHILFVGN